MSTDYKAMLESTSNHQPTVSNPVEPVVSCSSNTYDGRLKHVTFDGIFMRVLKTKEAQKGIEIKR